MGKKIRVGLIFGGKSGEHEVSLASAQSVARALDPEQYDAVLIGITKEGRWLTGGNPLKELIGATNSPLLQSGQQDDDPEPEANTAALVASTISALSAETAL